MKTAPLPENEAARLEALRDFAVLDTPPEPAFDDITTLAAQICKCPMALVSLVDADRQWFKSRRGLDAAETSRDVAFCAHAILNPEEVMVVPDTHKDERFAGNSLVTHEPKLRFYAGAPLVTESGEALGTVCVLDRAPGELNSGEIKALQALARQTMAQLESRRTDITLLRTELEEARCQIKALEGRIALQEKIQKALRMEHSFREAVIERAAEGVCVCHSIPEYPFVRFSVWNQRMTEITGYTMDEINRRGWYQTVYPDAHVQEMAVERMNRMREGNDLRHERWEITCADGSKRVVRISTSLLISANDFQHVLALMYDCTEEETLKQEAKFGRIDALTGVGTRRAFREETSLLLRLASRTGTPSALGFLDLDDLKVLNDTMGHAEGDRVLACLGATLAEWTRSTDVVGRLGGDEFGVFLPETDGASAKIFFDRFHKRLLDVIRDHDWPIGASVGVAIFPSAPPSDSDALKYADSLMYRAKKNGKNRVIYAEFSGDEDNIEHASRHGLPSKTP